MSVLKAALVSKDKLTVLILQEMLKPLILPESDVKIIFVKIGYMPDNTLSEMCYLKRSKISIKMQ